jgi:hypothetical protein
MIVEVVVILLIWGEGFVTTPATKYTEIRSLRRY